MVLVSAGLLISSLAQNYSPIVDDRVETDIIEVPEISQEAEHRGGLDLAAVISAAYDSNIFLSRNDPAADEVTRVGLAIAYTQGDSLEGEGGYIKLAYRPTGVIYARNGSNNRVDQEAALTAGWRGKVSSVTYAGAARKLGDATAETGSPTERVEFENEILAAWNVREKISVELGAGNSSAIYDDTALYDSSQTYGRLAVRYAYSPKTKVGMAYQAGRLIVDGGGNQTLQQVTMELAWQPREKIRIYLEAGAEHRDAEDGSEVNPVVDARIDWEPRKGTEVYLAGYVRQEASAYYAGQDYGAVGAIAGIAQRLGGGWTGRLDVGREKVTYNRVSGVGPSGREDEIWFVRPAVEYKLTDALDVSIFYRVSNDSSNAKNFGYRQTLAGIELIYQF